MQKIEKNNRLATAYADWEQTLGEAHPHYNSSKNEYYLDIVMSLFEAQKGLCAYTELRLCDPSEWADHLWENGRFKVRDHRFEGNLDHFDSSLKESKGWLWSNFFMIHSDINRRKSTKPSDLKPDSANYDPDCEMTLNLATGLYIAKCSQKQSDIDNLGINDDFVVARRKSACRKWKKYVNVNGLNFDDLAIDQFPTAAKVLRQSLKSPSPKVGPPPGSPA